MEKSNTRDVINGPAFFVHRIDFIWVILRLMGQAKRRNVEIGSCVYCSSVTQLSDEHVVPFGLGGKLVLRKASCQICAAVTGSLEQKLLRGHWWPQRVRAGLQSRTRHKELEPLEIIVIRSDGIEFGAQLPLIEQTNFIEFGFAAPSILIGKTTKGEPFSEYPTMRTLGNSPTGYYLDGERVGFKAKEQIRVPIDFSAVELTRFLAKVAHCFAISRRGLNCCVEFFLPSIVLGKTEGSKTYIGGASSELLGKRLPGSELHALMDRRNGDFLTVYIQLFRMLGDPPPIYEVVVGRLK